jgi:hypothetical protein
LKFFINRRNNIIFSFEYIPTFDISGVSVRLLHEKAMFIPEVNTLVVSDLHIGKTAYFRKKGIALPFSEKDKTIKI